MDEPRARVEAEAEEADFPCRRFERHRIMVRHRDVEGSGMTKPDDTIRVLIPLKVRKKNGRPKILPPANYRPSEDQTQDPHVLRAIGRARGWRRRMDAGEFSTIQELAEAVGLAERHVSRQLRLAYLAPEVLKRLTCGREASAVSLYDLCFLAGEAWEEQVERVFC